MFIHMFAFRWKPKVSVDQKKQAADAIRNLQGRIPGLLETWVGENISPRAAGYELGGVMQFPDQGAFEAYNEHPEHQKLLVWLKPLIEAIEVDFNV
jgi:hypothetical protein